MPKLAQSCLCLLSCTMPGSSTAAGKLTGALHRLKGTLWCKMVQRSRFPAWKHLHHFPHQHRCNLKTNTAWHQFSQISPKYSTLPWSTRDTKKDYSLLPLTETSCLPFPWTAWRYTFGLHLHPSLLSAAGQLNWYKPHLEGTGCLPFSSVMCIFCSGGHQIFSETRFWQLPGHSLDTH